MPDHPDARLRLAGLVEGTTLLLPEGVGVMGSVHGLAFLLYLYALAEAASTGAWSRRDIARAALACVLPFGTFLNDRRLRRRASAMPGGS